MSRKMVYYLSMRKWEDSMKITNLGGYPSIDSFVDAKLGRCNSSDRSFESLFELMFSESSNVLWEESKGYRVSKTRATAFQKLHTRRHGSIS